MQRASANTIFLVLEYSPHVGFFSEGLLAEALNNLSDTLEKVLLKDMGVLEVVDVAEIAEAFHLL